MKKIANIFIIIIILMSAMSLSAFAVRVDTFDVVPVPEGAIGVLYDTDSTAKLKTGIKKGESTYYYDLFGREEHEYFPLQMGEGSYDVTIYENISDNRYRVIAKNTVSATIEDPLSVYLNSIQTVNFSEDMKTVKKAAELTKGLKTDKEKIAAIYNYVTKNFKYDYEKIKGLDSTYVPNVDKILEAGKGICYDYSALFAAMLRSQGIPTKLIKGYTDNVKEYHAWNEVYLSYEERWIVVDTTYDAAYRQAGRKVSMEKAAKLYRPSKEF